MKQLFIPAKVKSEINTKKISELKLPKNIAIAYSIQYQETASEIKEILSKNHNITNFLQVLGCSKPKFSKDTKAVLLISSGKFHAVSLAVESNLPVYILEADKLRKISEEEISSLKKRKKASYMRFLNADKIGILISTKPGQENLQKALALKDKIKNKEIYLFISNEINPREFENFPEIKSWVNTACPRLDFDSSVINISDLNFSQPKNAL
ncbi:MAG: diphthamide synthesis protein [Candidatus Nanoarchaeia archaeon]|nr:diphthamide synthesis protein [Candidatus Nanoarchaeia archaeon]MDD5357564.1 diphthamide synthesis protein [Candidatus Nanoarchaeia archaeon]MDD5588483.1 diphthamide synthesis protein [Candidatus Nanoarchaeia archaeon]